MIKFTIVAFLVMSVSCLFGQDAWEQMNDFPLETRLAGSFTTTQYGYVLKMNGSNNSIQVFQYDPNADLWSQKNDFTEEINPTAVYGFNYAGEGYILASDLFSEYVLIYKYDEANDSWSLINNASLYIESLGPYYGSAFGMDNKVYVLTSSSENFHVYDLVLDTWMVLEAYPRSMPSNTRGLVINGRSYFLFYEDPQENVHEPYLYEYDTSNDTWIGLADYPGPVEGTFPSATFAIDNYIYAGMRAYSPWFYRYDTVSDTWQQIENSGQDSNFTASFALNGFGYLVAGEIINIPNNPPIIPLDTVWRLDPELLTLSNGENSELSITISPNPAHNLIRLYGTTTDAKFQIFDVVGTLVSEGISEKNTIDIQNLTSGLYLLSVVIDGQRLVKKLVKI